MSNTQILPPIEEEANDTPKKFTNFDTEDFNFSWDGRGYVVKPGETVVYPKYLVNYAAMHLARKIIKRREFAKYPDEKERMNSAMNLQDKEYEKELQEKAVAANFEEKEEPKEGQEEAKQEVKPVEKKFVCDVCQATFETGAKLRGHKLGKHPKPKISPELETGIVA